MKKGHRERRFPTEPLERQVLLRLSSDAYMVVSRPGKPQLVGTSMSGQATILMLDAPSQVQVARFLGVDRAQWLRFRRDGLTAQMADRLAVKALNLHPALLWPDWIEEVAA